jgi:hypothetical protein
VVIESSGSMISCKERAAVWAPEVTCTATLNGPLTLGVPLTRPPGESEIPDGHDPETVLQVYVPLPPVALSCWLYALPCTPFGSDAVMTAGGGDATVRLCRVAV